MRAMGPGSVSSLLKIALDVVYVILWILIGALILAAIGLLFVQIDYTRTVREPSFEVEAHMTGPTTAVWFAGGAFELSIVLFIVHRLRQLFQTLTAGDPFHPTNVTRLRAIGVGLAALTLTDAMGHFAIALYLTKQASLTLSSVNLTSWFAVLVVFVLAEVFREGARLRREAELTI